MGVVLGFTGTFEYDGAPRLRGRRQVVIAIFVPCNLPRSVICIGVHKLPHDVVADQYVEVSPSISCLELSLNHVSVSSPAILLHSCVRICLLLLENIFYSLFSSIPDRWPVFVSHYLKIYHGLPLL